jgi:hypothetical protein
MLRASGYSWRSATHRWFLLPGCPTSATCSIGRSRHQVRTGLDIDHRAGCLYAACDGGALVAISATTGEFRAQWPLAGAPDATFFNPASGLVHVAIEEPGQIQTIDPRTGTNTCFTTASGAPTTALVPPDHLYVFSPYHRGVLDLSEASEAPHSGIYKPE